jgi:hypothetical protein
VLYPEEPIPVVALPDDRQIDCQMTAKAPEVV